MRSRSRFGRTVRQATQDRFGTRRTDPAAAGRPTTIPPRRRASPRRGLFGCRCAVCRWVDGGFLAREARFGLAGASASASAAAWVAPSAPSVAGVDCSGLRARGALRLGRCLGCGLGGGRAAPSAPSADGRRPRRSWRARRASAWPVPRLRPAGGVEPLAAASAASACSVSAAAFASATDTSLRMSMRQPVRRAASRAFWPSRPMASESIRSGTVTLAIRCSSSMSTDRTWAGLSALATNRPGRHSTG